MSWKPSRSSGLMFDKFYAKSESHRKKYFALIEDQSYLDFNKINSLSKNLYLYWLNENKKHSALVGKSHSNFYSLEVCARFPSIIPMLKRNINLVYKPFQKHLTNDQAK